jgi:hypothetical protein
MNIQLAITWTSLLSGNTTEIVHEREKRISLAIIEFIPLKKENWLGLSLREKTPRRAALVTRENTKASCKRRKVLKNRGSGKAT